jgi:uncharacterized protein YfiM (DUF2279 family)
MRFPTRRWSAALAAAIVLLASAAALPSTARAERFLLPRDREGSWLAADKSLHFAGSFAAAASFRVEGRRERDALAFTIGLGVAKEVYDAAFKPARYGARGASRKDLVVDILGAAAGVLFIRAIDR